MKCVHQTKAKHSIAIHLAHGDDNDEDDQCTVTRVHTRDFRKNSFSINSVIKRMVWYRRRQNRRQQNEEKHGRVPHIPSAVFL